MRRRTLIAISLLIAISAGIGWIGWRFWHLVERDPLTEVAPATTNTPGDLSDLVGTDESLTYTITGMAGDLAVAAWTTAPANSESTHASPASPALSLEFHLTASNALLTALGINSRMVSVIGLADGRTLAHYRERDNDGWTRYRPLSGENWEALRWHPDDTQPETWKAFMAPQGATSALALAAHWRSGIPVDGTRVPLLSRRGPSVVVIGRLGPTTWSHPEWGERPAEQVSLVVERTRDGAAERFSLNGLILLLDQASGVLLEASMPDVPVVGDVRISLTQRSGIPRWP